MRFYLLAHVRPFRVVLSARRGEIGLDYHYNFSEQAVQRDVFARQLREAVALKKPIIVHSREAEEDTIKLMCDACASRPAGAVSGPDPLRRKVAVPVDWPVHVHCFTSSVKMAEALLAHFSKLYIGFTGVITFKNSEDVRSVVKAVPLNRILLETGRRSPPKKKNLGSQLLVSFFLRDSRHPPRRLTSSSQCRRSLHGSAEVSVRPLNPL